MYLRYPLILFFFCFSLLHIYVAQFVAPDSFAIIFSEASKANKTRKGKSILKKKNLRSKIRFGNVDHVRNIRVRIVDTQNYDIELSWKPIKGEKSEYIVASYGIVIESKKNLRKSKVLAIKSSKTSRYLEKGLRKGIYYFAVVSKQRVGTANGNLKLVPNENFTVIPIIVSSRGIRIAYEFSENVSKFMEIASTVPTDSITSQLVVLDGQNLEAYIKVSWTWSKYQTQSLFIYRSNEIINSVDAIKKAIQIREVSLGVNFLEDYEIHRDRKYYYAVIGKNLQNIEHVILEKDVSFTSKPVLFSSRDHIPIVSFIGARKINKNLILLEWKDILPSLQRSDLFYSLYRSNQPILSTGQLVLAEKLATFSFNQLSFEDYIENSGKYFYALMTESTSGQQSRTFRGNMNITVVGVYIDGNNEQDTFRDRQIKDTVIGSAKIESKKDLSIDNIEKTSDRRLLVNFLAKQDDSGIYISWNYFVKDKFLRKEFSHILLYRFRHMPEKQGDFKRGVLIRTLDLHQKSYMDDVENDGPVFYAIFLYNKRSGEISPHQFLSQYNTIGPIFSGYVSENYGTYLEPSLEKGKEFALIKKKENKRTLTYSKAVNFDSRDLHFDKKKEKRRVLFETKNDETFDTDLKNITKNNSNVVDNKEISNALDSLIQETFFLKRYGIAVKMLSSFLDDNSNLSNLVKAKALLYIGLSLFYLKDYDTSVQYLRNTLVRKYYKERAEFWFREIKERSS